MADTHAPEIRSYNMSRIRSVSKPEEKVRKYLFSRGFRYRKNDKRLPGSPDIVLKKYNVVIFVQGCFWHKHDCGRFRWPETNKEYWRAKIQRNIERDITNQEALKNAGWKVLLVWECELKKSVFNHTMLCLEEEILKGE